MKSSAGGLRAKPALLSPTCRLRGALLSSQAVGVSSSAASIISDRH
jgi:hypothetical protein